MIPMPGSFILPDLLLHRHRYHQRIATLSAIMVMTRACVTASATTTT
jgi:hypothetical protein